MKKILLYLLFTSSLLANDPTDIKGKLKDVLNLAQKTLNTPLPQEGSKKETQGEQGEEKPEETLLEKLQRSMDTMSFKAYFAQEAKTRLMVEVNKKVFFLEAKRQVLLNGELFFLESFDKYSAQFVHTDSNTLLTYNYGR